ncbi:HNH endonuclease [Variovorax sp. W6]|uniref:HNH endonuclease n=1 Tax=Variovorax sp. W6 TaxID=3093895 RepID=UPI003D80881A
MLVFDACVASTGTPAIQQRLIAARSTLEQGYGYYVELAQTNSLYSIHPTELENDEPAVLQVTVKDLKNLYSQQLSVKGRPPRSYYDKILALAPRGKCPFCGFGHASTLDHVLSKSKFPWFSVLPVNLVPACKDCNHGKGNKVAILESEQILHPYFENAVIGQQQWLFATIQPTSPASAVFFPSPPADWDAALKTRVSRHFEEFELARRFSVEAATEIAGLVPMLSRLASKAGKEGVKSQLELMSSSSMEIEPNSWRSALLQALAGNEWYWRGGFEPAR